MGKTIADAKGIAAQVGVMEPSLLRVSWSVFSREGELGIGYGQETAVIRLRGIHFFASRQSLIGPAPKSALGDGCTIEYLMVTDEGAFLEAYLSERLGFDCSVKPQDIGGRTSDDAQFVIPVYLNLMCSDGVLDIVCESVEMELFERE
jgi:hypothetical protein